MQAAVIKLDEFWDSKFRIIALTLLTYAALC